jgi:hypothetical protein
MRAIKRRSKGLRGIFNQGQVMLSRHVLQGVPIRWMAKSINSQDRSGARRDRRFDKGRVNAKGSWVSIDEDGHSTFHEDAIGRGNEARRRGNHLVSRTQSEGTNNEMKRTRSDVDGQSMANSDVSGRPHPQMPSASVQEQDERSKEH